MTRIAEVVFPYSFRQSFTYLVPAIFEREAAVGKRALPLLGKGYLPVLLPEQANMTQQKRIVG
jgi:hypothetical protein